MFKPIMKPKKILNSRNITPSTNSSAFESRNSYPKFGSLALAVLCALTSVNAISAETQPAIITTETSYTEPVQITSTIAGNYNNTTDSYLTSIMVTGTNGKLTGQNTLTVNLSNPEPPPVDTYDLILLGVDEGANLEWNGDVSLSSISSKAYEGTCALGVWASSAIIKGNVDIKMVDSADFSGQDKHQYVTGIDLTNPNGQISNLSISDGTLGINVSTTGKEGSYTENSNIETKGRTAVGIRMEDPGSAFNIDSSSTSITADAVRGDVTGINAINQAKLIGKGSLTITTSGGRSATGIEIRDGASVEWTGDLTSVSNLKAVNIEGADNEAGNIGIFYPEQAQFVPSSITISGNIDLTAKTISSSDENEALAYNVLLDSKVNKDPSKVLEDKIILGGADKTVKLSASILSSKEKDEANSLCIGNGKVEILGKSVLISAIAEGEGTAYGVYMNGGQVDLGSSGGSVDVSAKADSGNANALQIEAGTLNLNGDTTISSGSINSVGSGKIVVNGNLNLSSLDIINGNVLTIKGSVTTTSGSVFTNAASGTATTFGETLYKDKLDFQDKSKLILTDAEYTLAYLKNIQDSLKEAPIVQMTGKIAGNSDLTIDDLPTIAGTILSKAELKLEGNTTLTGSVLTKTEAGVGFVNLGEGNQLTIAAGTDKNFSIVGGNGELVSGKGPVALIVGNSTTSGSLTIGGDGTEGGTLNGTLEINQTSQVQVKGNAGVAAEFAISSQVSVNDASELVITDGAKLISDIVKVAKDATVRVGTNVAQGVGVFVAKNLNLLGKLLLDPSWTNGSPAQGAYENADITQGGQITVGQNSTLVLGSDDPDLAKTAINHTGMSLAQGKIEAALYLAKPISLGSGSIIVDGSLTQAATNAAPGSLVVAKNALLAVEVTDETATGKAVAINDGTVNFADGSYLLLTGLENLTTTEDLQVKLANTVTGTLLDDHIYGSSGLWYNYMLKDGIVTADYDPTGAMTQLGLIAPNTTREGLLANNPYMESVRQLLNSGNLAGAAEEMNRIAMVGAASGTQIAALNASNMIFDTIDEHGSSLAAYSHDKKGLDLWIDLNSSFSKASKYEVASSRFGYKSDIGGVAVGADYSFGNGFAVGMAFSFGKGSIRGQNSGAGVKNKIEYYGINFYGVQSSQYANLIGTVGYLHTKNKISSAFGGSAKPNGNSFVAALKAEKPLAVANQFTVTPHVGLRYTYSNIDSFKSNGFKYTNKKVNLVQLPVGVAFNAEVKAPCGATVKPFVDVSVVPALGHRKVKNSFGLADGTATDKLETRIANNALLQGKVGVESAYKNHSFSLNYGLGAGNKGRVDQALQARYRYSF